MKPTPRLFALYGGVSRGWGEIVSSKTPFFYGKMPQYRVKRPFLMVFCNKALKSKFIYLCLECFS